MASSATSVRGYRVTLGPWDTMDVTVKLPADRWDDGRVVIAPPELEIKDDPYIITTVLRPKQARALAKQLTRAANLIDPPTPRKKAA